MGLAAPQSAIEFRMGLLGERGLPHSSRLTAVEENRETRTGLGDSPFTIRLLWGDVIPRVPIGMRIC